MPEYDRINISEGIHVNKSNLSLTKTHQKKDPRYTKTYKKQQQCSKYITEAQWDTEMQIEFFPMTDVYSP